ncbi:MAG: glutamate racemase [Thermodesulfobacteriota bacterium]
MSDKPIGIFDSGIGGLTVLKELVRVLPEENTVYLGDTARVPYGTKSADTVIRYSLEIAEFLTTFDIKALVVACNTASAYALEALKKKLSVPVIGVIEPGARMAAGETKNKKIGVIGTEGTIRSNAYPDAIKTVSPNISVFAKACPLFVPLAEEGWTDNEPARLTTEIYLGSLKKEGIDVLLLGCTHYPLLKNTISSVMGKDVSLIDSGCAVSIEVKRILLQEGTMRKGDSPPQRRFFVTDSPERFTTVGRRFLNDNGIKPELVRIGS